MTILSLDTSSAAGSAAIVRDGAIVIERAGDAARPHGERLPRDLMTLLAETRLDVHDIDCFAVAIGPGSFTGLRIGIATIQGLALAQDTPVVPVSTFEALQKITGPTADVTGIWIDAHRGEVFATLYDASGRVLHEPALRPPDATLDAWAGALAGRRLAFAGDGAVRYRQLIADRFGGTAEIPATVPPLAGSIGLIAGAAPGRAVAPHAVIPLYVRRSEAEVTRDRRQQTGGA